MFLLTFQSFQSIIGWRKLLTRFDSVFYFKISISFVVFTCEIWFVPLINPISANIDLHMWWKAFHDKCLSFFFISSALFYSLLHFLPPFFVWIHTHKVVASRLLSSSYHKRYPNYFFRSLFPLVSQQTFGYHVRGKNKGN